MFDVFGALVDQRSPVAREACSHLEALGLDLVERAEAPGCSAPQRPPPWTIRNLEDLLHPQSVAVIGASNRPRSVGSTVTANLRASFKGPIYPVNPKHREVGGLRAFETIEQLPQVPSLAVICTPPKTVADLVARLGRFGTRAAIVMTGGLTKAQKRSVLDAARPHLLRVLGPNCIGLMTPRIGLNATFAHADALPGELALVSQSGALVTAMLDWANARRIGFSHLISLGERADVDIGDLLDVLASDGRTRAILLYAESIEAPRKFMSAARAAARNKPVIVVKAGRAGQGVQAAASHTGAMAGSDLVYDAAIRARRHVARRDAAGAAGGCPDARALQAQHQRNADDRHQRRRRRRAGRRRRGRQRRGALRTRCRDDRTARCRAARELVARQSDRPDRRRARRALHDDAADLARGAQDRRDPVHACTDGDRRQRRDCEGLRAARGRASRSADRMLARCEESVAQARRIFEDAGIANFATPEEAVSAFTMLQTYRRNQETLLEAPAAGECRTHDVRGARAHIERALAEGREWLTEVEAKDVLRAYAIPVVPTTAVPPDPQAAAEAARELGYPAALKIVSHDITHKSDVGGVRLDLAGDDEMRSAAESMLARVRERQPKARIEGLSVQPMVARRHATELIVGASVDPVFGPVILFGHGGTAAEAVGDRAVALPPLNRPLALELIWRTRIARLLGGYRDRPPADVEAVQDVLVAVSRMLADLPEVAELDINPLLADDEGVVALDARIRLDPSKPAGAARFAIRPYPEELVERVEWQGRTIVLRPIRPEDEAQHRAFLGRLDGDDIRMRIFHSRRELPRNELARLTQIDYAREMAFIAEGARDGGKPETLGVVRAVSDPDNVEAEFGIIVRSDLKSLGLGQLLLDKMIRYARALGLQRLAATVLRENHAMQELAKANGFEIDGARSDADALHFVLGLGEDKAAADGTR